MAARRQTASARTAPQPRSSLGAFVAAALALLTATTPPTRATELAARTLLLDAALAGPAVVAVGERGTILRSPDNAQSWTAAKTPTVATLTGVSFADPEHGWAVGHDALILVTADGGVTWTKQWQGDNLSDSFLDVLALDSMHAIAVGAYGLCTSTSDAGKTWTRQRVQAEDYHLNAITRGPSGTLYIAGEHGTLLRSLDAGATWTAMRSPYAGSFYGVLPIDGRTLLAYGLRARVFRSTDDGATWTAIDVGRTELIATGIRERSGTLLLAGQTRVLLVSLDDGITFAPRDAGVTTGIAQLLEMPDGHVLTLGEAGAKRIESAVGSDPRASVSPAPSEIAGEAADRPTPSAHPTGIP
jgi:photosystem II stability/assembly factor-like uncharacterized protein